jgi:hypothetical protein
VTNGVSAVGSSKTNGTASFRVSRICRSWKMRLPAASCHLWNARCVSGSHCILNRTTGSFPGRPLTLSLWRCSFVAALFGWKL